MASQSDCASGLGCSAQMSRVIKTASSGNKIGSDLRLTVDPATSFLPSLTSSGTEYGVAWRDDRDGNQEIYFARLDIGGNMIGSEVRVTNDGAASSAPSLVSNGSGYGLAWHDRRDGIFEIYFARFDAAGNKIGGDVRVTERPCDGGGGGGALGFPCESTRMFEGFRSR